MNALIMDMGDGVKGDSSLPGYKGKIELLTFDVGGAARGTSYVGVSERDSGRPDHQGFAVSKYRDAASPVMHRALDQGKVFPQVCVVIGLHERGEVQELMRHTMSGVMITSHTVEGGAGRVMVEIWTLSYDKLTTDYRPRHVAEE